MSFTADRALIVKHVAVAIYRAFVTYSLCTEWPLCIKKEIYFVAYRFVLGPRYYCLRWENPWWTVFTTGISLVVVCASVVLLLFLFLLFFLLTHVGSQNVLNELCLHHWFQYHQLLVVGYTGVTCCGPGLLWQLIPVARACQTISDVVFAGWTHWLWQKSQFVSIWLHILTIHPSSKYKVIIPFMIVCNCVAAYAKKIRISTQRTCTRKHQIICNAEQKLYWLTPVGTSFFITVL